MFRSNCLFTCILSGCLQEQFPVSSTNDVTFCLNRLESGVFEKILSKPRFKVIAVNVQIIMAHKDIYYSDKYTDDKYEYRYMWLR